MNRKDFEEFIEKEFEPACKNIRQAKGHNYSGDTDAFANFKKIAAMLEESAPRILWVYLQKQLDAILSFLNESYVSDTESIETRLYDAHNYILLLAGLLKDLGQAYQTHAPEENIQNVNDNTGQEYPFLTTKKPWYQFWK